MRDTGSYLAEDVVVKHMNKDLTEATFWQESMERLSDKVDEFENLFNQLSS
ncbi:hypothetical protein JCM19239_5748 [Vibrio variabilis]|uniref:Uncharacterized protein n=1 Tax=Vibrio variabilis TaxID=990271 RepID=A0ABQ0JNI2_9VIBR|nr:hypothetical protein JCM19239_5748 [Vibrio variabilis]